MSDGEQDGEMEKRNGRREGEGERERCKAWSWMDALVCNRSQVASFLEQANYITLQIHLVKTVLLNQSL